MLHTFLNRGFLFFSSVPTFRLEAYTSLQNAELQEDVDDQTYLKRHQRHENEERRRKRYDSMCLIHLLYAFIFSVQYRDVFCIKHPGSCVHRVSNKLLYNKVNPALAIANANYYTLKWVYFAVSWTLSFLFAFVRWDLQRLREAKMIEKLKQNQALHKAQVQKLEAHQVDSVFPKAENGEACDFFCCFYPRVRVSDRSSHSVYWKPFSLVLWV